MASSLPGASPFWLKILMSTCVDEAFAAVVRGDQDAALVLLEDGEQAAKEAALEGVEALATAHDLVGLVGRIVGEDRDRLLRDHAGHVADVPRPESLGDLADL